MEIPTPTLLVTNIGTVCMSPGLFPNRRKLFNAVDFAMKLDDFFDFEVTPRPSVGLDFPNLELHSNNQLYLKYIQSLRKFEKRCNKTEINNVRWFTSKIHFLEGNAISTPKDEWTFEKVKKYREDVALVWAVFLSSFHSKKNTLDISEIDKDFGFNNQNIINWAKTDDDKSQLEKKSTLKLYYSALVFQIVSDFGKQKHANEHFIPNFFLEPDYNNQSLELLKHYIEMSIVSGCNDKLIHSYVRGFNFIQKTLSMFGGDKKYDQWLYS